MTVADDATWSAMTTAQFAAFDAIVFGDPSCDNIGGRELLNTAEVTKSVWSAAITGPVYIQGTDPVYHQFPGGRTLIADGLDLPPAVRVRVSTQVSVVSTVRR